MCVKRMPNYLAIPALILYFVPALLAQAGSPADSVVSKPSYSEEAYVLERSSRKIKFENDGTSSVEDTARVRIQSDAGVQHYGLLTFSYASGTGPFEIDYVRVRKTDGSVVITPPDSIQDMAAEITRSAPFYSDLREKHVAVKGLGVGDVLEFHTHERVTKPLAPGQFWLEYSFFHDAILLEEKLEVSVPRERAIKIKSADTKPVISESGEYRVYTWSASNLQHKEQKNEKQEQAKTTWQQARGLFPQPDVLISSFQSWDEVGRWYGNLQKERVKPDADVEAKAAELTKGLADDDTKLRAIYRYVSEQFRYIGVAFGIGRYQPHSASDVLANQYGDCKDKHTLLASLLGAAGIKAYPALISSVRDIDPDMPSPVEFNHVITVVPRANGLIWLDSTPEVGPFRYLMPPLRDKRALAIWDDKPPTLVNTPAELPFQSTQIFHMDAKLSDAGLLEGNADFTSRGDVELVLRTLFRSVPLPQWKELGQRISLSFGFGGEVSGVTAAAPEKTDEAFHFSYKYTRKDFGDWTNHHTLAPAPAISLPSPLDEGALPSTPMWLGPPTDIVFHTQVEMPKGYTPEVPDAIHLKCSVGEYDATYAFKDGLLVADRHFRTITSEVPNGASEEYRYFFKRIQDDYASYIPLVSSKSSARDEVITAASSLQNSIRNLPDSSDHEALRLEEEARDAASRKDMQSAISSLYRAVAADPKFTRAWVMLGGLLMSSNQMDAGRDAFSKAVAADPKQAVTQKAFGYSLMFAMKLEDAVAVWKDFIKIAPDDVDGPANLGSALLMLKRYDEAALALESAVKLKPDRVTLEWQLASAYLHTSHDDKATTALHKLLELAPGAQMLNNAAYEMAETDKQLPLALEYAEKAVREEEEASSKIEMSKLQLEDLRHAETLAYYWDTLGWVQNRMSNLDGAKKNLNAAWRMSQDGTPAAHLCHVYNREHSTQAGIAMCRMALHRLPLSAAPAQVADLIGETKLALTQLSRGSTNGNDLNSAIDEVIRMRTFKLTRLLPGTETAEFFVLLGVDPKTSSFKAEDVKFINGSEKLKSLGKVLTSIHYNLPSPDGAPSRVVRRGTLGCYPSSGCEFVLFEPNSVRSLN